MAGLPEAFQARMRELLGDEADAFLDSLGRPAERAVRANPGKLDPAGLPGAPAAPAPSGIRADAVADDLGGVDLALQAQGVPVLVPTADAAEARQLINGGSPNDTGAGELYGLQRMLVRLLSHGDERMAAADDERHT